MSISGSGKIILAMALQTLGVVHGRSIPRQDGKLGYNSSEEQDN